MEFQVSARKWRPRKFSELIGQEHIVRTLCNAIRLDRVSHAYLFSGTRGVGKTTTARILAKALNCAEGPTTEPCDACSFCSEIREGHSIDVREIDGASNNGVAEVRDLIENVQYATSACRYKVYIIDEVHMLSKSAFNALLKTLEEPPPKVIFIFATTELSKIPETILSRCQCFEFKPLSHRQIVHQMEQICRQEGITIDQRSLEEIAKTGAGSMRDAQSLIDQVIAYCGKEIQQGAVEEVLGIVGQKALENFVDRLIARDPAALIEQVEEVVTGGKDLHYFCRDLAEYLRNLIFVKVSQNPATLLNTHTCNLEVLGKQAAELDVDEIQQMFTVISRTEMEMRRSPLAQMVFEMACLRLTDVRPFRDIDAMIEKINSLQESGPVGEVPEAVEPTPPASPVRQPAARGETNTGSQNVPLWDQVTKEILNRKSMFSHYLAHCRVARFDTSILHLEFPDPYTLDLVKNDENLKVVRDALKKICGRDLEVRLTLNQNEKKTEKSGPPPDGEPPSGKIHKPSGQKTEFEIIQAALDVFGGAVQG